MSWVTTALVGRVAVWGVGRSCWESESVCGSQIWVIGSAEAFLLRRGRSRELGDREGVVQSSSCRREEGGMRRGNPSVWDQETRGQREEGEVEA